VYNGKFLVDPPQSFDGDSKQHNYQNEFIGLLNLNADTILLSGWKICDDDILGD
tara:strand:- start:1909 stop:2070 length:162 start_codon:yes stop_codon:yes gene_type:complete